MSGISYFVMFSRRRHVSILGVQAWIASPEDVILRVRFAMNGSMILKNDLGGEMGMSMSTEPKFDSKKEYPAAELSRREFVAVAAAAAAGFVRHPGQARPAIVRTDPATLPTYGNGTIPAGIRSRAVAPLRYGERRPGPASRSQR